ncbi:MAG: CHC2 zinc finger domain-containing protein [Thermodesulfobacteriota bacterium]|nr:CHC2 zinc finger domain-containing protein [Thermodesulfobacteriota bacterium]
MPRRKWSWTPRQEKKAGQTLDIQQAKGAIDLVRVVKAEGIEVNRAGSRHVGRCPFHDEENPSFFVFPDGHYHCFSCGQHGDAISFIQKLHGCSFKEALQRLGIDQGPLTSEQRAEIRQRQHGRELVKAFRQWEAEASAEAGFLCRVCRKYLGRIKTVEHLDKYGFLYDLLERCQYHLDILTGRDDRAKYELYSAGYYG